MKKLLPISIATLALTAAGGTSQAAPVAPPESLLGNWSGLSDRHTNPPNPVTPASLALHSVANRRLVGTLDLVAVVPCVFPVDLTLSASGRLTGGGVDDHEHRVILHGRVAAYGDGSVRIAALQWRASDADGSVLVGHLGLVQKMGGKHSESVAGANVTGHWRGSYASAGGASGGLEMELVNLGGEKGSETRRPSTNLAGRVVFEDDVTGDGSVRWAADLMGSIDPAVTDRPARFALFGLQSPPEPVKPTGPLAVLIGMTNPPERVKERTLEGEYFLYDSLSSLVDDIVQGADRTLDRGTFVLPAVQ